MDNEEYSKEEEGETCEGGCCGMGCEGYEGHDMGCGHMYGMGCRGRHHLLRWVLGIAILAFVFGAGIKLGELKERMAGVYESNYGGGYNMMQRGGYTNAPEVYYYRSSMMQGLPGAQQAPTTAR